MDPAAADAGTQILTILKRVALVLRPRGDVASLTGDQFARHLATSGAIALFVYLTIASSQLRLGRVLRAEDRRPAVRMWLFPYLTGAVIAFIVVILVLMIFDNEQREAIIFSAISAAIIVGAGFIVEKRSGETHSTPSRISSP